MPWAQGNQKQNGDSLAHRIKNPRIWCSKCGSCEVVAIVYGMPLERIDKPDKGLLHAAEKGYIELGGCCIDEDSPNFRCKGCGNGFRR